MAKIESHDGIGTAIGSIFFEYARNGSLHVYGKLANILRSATGLNGLHIHEHGDLTQGCTSAGSHFNPTGRNHGYKGSSERHIGDLGNIHVNGLDTTAIDIYDELIQLYGTNSIIGRSIVVSSGYTKYFVYVKFCST